MPDLATVVERVTNIQSDLQEIKAAMASIAAQLHEMSTYRGQLGAEVQRHTTQIDDLTATLFGSRDSPGLIVRIDRLERWERMQRWILALVTGAVVAEGIHLIGNMLHK